MLRGGGWNNNGRNCRSANRNGNEPDNRNDNIGFRLARALLQLGGEAQPRHPPRRFRRGKQEGSRRVSSFRSEPPSAARLFRIVCVNSPFLPSDFPASWASGWGQDRYGLWQSFTVQGVIQVMRWIPSGKFKMGSPEKETDFRWADETQHDVTLSHGYWLADTACTQALWRAVLGETPSLFEGDARPVKQVSWTDIRDRFLPTLNQLVPGLEAVLPSEAQWEYACRAGTQTPFSFGDTLNTDQANYDGNHAYGKGEKGVYRQHTVDVKALPANGWGLYQMHGNVWEWCADWLGDHPREAVTDPVGPPEGRVRLRVLRGGGWYDSGRFCRSADRFGREPDFRGVSIGFRLARGPSPRQAASVGVADVVDGGGAPASAPDSPTRGEK